MVEYNLKYSIRNTSSENVLFRRRVVFHKLHHANEKIARNQ